MRTSPQSSWQILKNSLQTNSQPCFPLFVFRASLTFTIVRSVMYTTHSQPLWCKAANFAVPHPELLQSHMLYRNHPTSSSMFPETSSSLLLPLVPIADTSLPIDARAALSKVQRGIGLQIFEPAYSPLNFF